MCATFVFQHQSLSICFSVWHVNSELWQAFCWFSLIYICCVLCDKWLDGSAKLSMLSLDSVTQSQTFLRPSASFCWSLNLARVYNESLSNGYSCRPELPELPEFALCPMCTPALLQLLPGVTTASQCFPPNHLHRCHGQDSVVGSPRKQRGLDEDPHKQCQHLLAHQNSLLCLLFTWISWIIKFCRPKLLHPQLHERWKAWNISGQATSH